MYVFLDESGDLGFNFENKGTPRYFIITLLVCKDIQAVNQLANAVKRTLKNKLKNKHSSVVELKGTGTSLPVKQYFYSHASRSRSWELYSIALDKHRVKRVLKELPSEHRIYNYLSREILRQVDLSNLQKGLLVTVDKRKGRRGINEFNKYLSHHLEATLPLDIAYDISHEQSHNNCGLQAVDVFCWGVRRLYEYNDDEWFSIYKDRLTLIEADKFKGIKKDGP